MVIKDPEEFKRRRARQKVEGAQAMAEYKKAEDAALDRLLRLRGERALREAAYGSDTGKKKKTAKRKARISPQLSTE